MGHSSSRQPRHPNFQHHIGNLNDVENHPDDTWPPSSLAQPPPYSSVVAQEMNCARHRGPPSAAALSPSTFQTFASFDRLGDIAYLRAPMRRESKENALEMLREYDTVIIMDDSLSMQRDRRWEQACKALSELAQTAAMYDKDGIDIHFLNHPKYGTDIKLSLKDGRSVRQLFKDVKPRGSTPIGNKLDVLVGDYIEKLERATRRKRKGDASVLRHMKPVNFIVITDGAPTDEPVDSIVALARRLDRGNYPLAQVGIQFVQIGEDIQATEFLKQLDDDLSGDYGVRDMVDTTPFLGIDLSAEVLIKILLGGINRRVDRRGGKAVMNV